KSHERLSVCFFAINSRLNIDEVDRGIHRRSETQFQDHARSRRSRAITAIVRSRPKALAGSHRSFNPVQPVAWLFPVIFTILLLALVAPAKQKNKPAHTFDAQAARGKITQVVALEDPAQSYALYLPSQYPTNRRWPVIYAFDPVGRGKTAVEV